MTMRSVVNPKRQHGAQIVEYCLLIAVLSISLVVLLPRLGNGICELNNRVGGLLGAASLNCPASPDTGNSGAGNNGGGNNTGSGTNGGGNNNGGGTGPGGTGTP